MSPLLVLLGMWLNFLQSAATECHNTMSPTCTKLTFDNDVVMKTIPDLSQLTSLVTLEIDRVQELESYPDFSVLPSLKDLTLTDRKVNPVNSLPDLSMLTTLRTLTTSEQTIHGDPRNAYTKPYLPQALDTLRLLNLEKAMMPDLRAVTSLKTLVLTTYRSDTIYHLDVLSSLEHLEIDQAQAVSHEVPLPKSLKFLKLYYGRQLLVNVAGPALKHVDLYQTSAVVGNLPVVEYLSLRNHGGNGIESRPTNGIEIYPYFSDLTRLKSLRVESQTATAIPNVEGLSLEYLHLSGSILCSQQDVDGEGDNSNCQPAPAPSRTNVFYRACRKNQIGSGIKCVCAEGATQTSTDPLECTNIEKDIEDLTAMLLHQEATLQQFISSVSPKCLK